MGSHRPISKIAIVGAGPSGVAAAKYLLAEHAFQKIDIFEQRSTVGGIWNYSKPQWSSKVPIPQVDPNFPIDDARPSEVSDHAGPRFESPLYDNLETNIPHTLMQHSDKPFPKGAPLFPPHRMVMQYLEEYAEPVRHLIEFDTRIDDVRRDISSSYDEWVVKRTHLPSSKSAISSYDAIVAASGHYTVPTIPQITGIKEWNKSHPNVIIHSKAYRNPVDFRNKKVLVVGNSASGVDIAAQISSTCAHPLLLSSRSESFMDNGAQPWKRDVPEIVEFLPPDSCTRAVKFKDGSIESDMDAVVFCTGYFYSYPFLRNIKPPIITDGLRTRDVYQHLFHIEYPTLVFPVLNLKIIPFPMAENQAAVFSRVWSERLRLPSRSEMREWERQVFEKMGSGKDFHKFVFPMDANYLDMLYEWADGADRVEGLENKGRGKVGVYWGERGRWLRERFGSIKKAFAAHGERRQQIQTVEQLGFDYEKWRKEKMSDEHS